MVKLKCVGRYRNSVIGIVHVPGDVFDVGPALAKFLFADAPGCFEHHKPEPVKKAPVKKPRKKAPVKKAPAKPPENKAVETAENK